MDPITSSIMVFIAIFIFTTFVVLIRKYKDNINYNIKRDYVMILCIILSIVMPIYFYYTLLNEKIQESTKIFHKIFFIFSMCVFVIPLASILSSIF